MKVISSLQSISQRLAVRLYTRNRSSADRQRGASALEYIVLAAGLIIVIAAAVAYLNDNNSLGSAFTSLFSKAQENVAAPSPAGG